MYSVSLPKDKRASFYLTEVEINIKVFPEDNDNVGVFFILNVLIIAVIIYSSFSQSFTPSLLFILFLLLFIYSFGRRFALGDREITIKDGFIIIKINNKISPVVKKLSFDKHNFIDQVIKFTDVKEIIYKKLSSRIRGNLFRIFLILNSGLKVVLCEVKEPEFATYVIDNIKIKIGITK
jgi:hypothetical protein